ncbi:MAG TPA: CoA-binding protein [Chitinophagaceae bacterium]|nr:MAG: CoA-binding protein [Bacteroidetes bacterium OLB11]HMN31793.1 CoA-binding protein [Chitinophagaceae bacterium]
MHLSKVFILGISNNEKRNSFLTYRFLQNIGHQIVGIPLHNEQVQHVELPIISKDTPHTNHVETVSIFVTPVKQKKYYQAILDLKPKQIIFNPGYENQELAALASQQNIKTYFGCTIALYSMGVI